MNKIIHDLPSPEREIIFTAVDRHSLVVASDFEGNDPYTVIVTPSIKGDNPIEVAKWEEGDDLDRKRLWRAVRNLLYGGFLKDASGEMRIMYPTKRAYGTEGDNDGDERDNV